MPKVGFKYTSKFDPIDVLARKFLLDLTDGMKELFDEEIWEMEPVVLPNGEVGLKTVVTVTDNFGSVDSYEL